MKEVWEIEKERARRARNIILLNFPETNVPKEQLPEKDREEVEKLFKDHLKLSEMDFKKAYMIYKEAIAGLLKYLADKVGNTT